MGLTVKGVAKATKPGRYGDGHGLYLEVASPTNRYWVYRYSRLGREHWLGLGPLHTVDLNQARDRARQARLQLLDGIDPLQAREAARAAQAVAAAKAMSFAAATEAYFAQHAEKWKTEKHWAQFMATMQTYVFPHIGRLPVAAIDTTLVLKCVEPLWRTKTDTADRVRARIEAVLGWATVRGYRTGDNPARWRDHLSEVLPGRGQVQKVQHHPALDWRQVPAFMAALATREGTAARALEFVVLTAARTSEVTGALWQEISGDVWCVPADRIKGGKQHRVPLCTRAVALLNALPRETGNPFIFIGGSKGSGLSHMAMTSTLKRMAWPTHLTVHGFRSTFRDWAAESTGYPNHVVEMALAHVIGNAVEAAYRRGDLFEKRVALMNDWSRYCSGLPNVVALRSA